MRWFVLMLLLWMEASYGFMMPRFSIETTVLDESGAPVEGAMVRADYLGATASDGSVERAWTDSDGIATVTGRSVFYVALTANKDGYYQSGTKVYAKEVVNGKELYPDRKVTLVLKEKRNPIPLYAKRYSGEIPVAEEWVGFDLEVGDWLSPYGRGASADFQFWFQGKLESINSGYGELKLKFSDSDGIVEITDVSKESELRVPHIAPMHGYVNEEIVWRAAIRRDVEGRPDRNRLHFLRVRTILDEDGEVEAANYAKMYGDVLFSLIGRQGGVSRIQFQYYFNPAPNDRNLEFDTNRNLFGKLPHEEQVREP
jgi:hypothetical protein